MLSSSGSLNQPYEYVGYYSESSIGLKLTGKRWYDSDIGRFISSSRNLPYAFKKNNPINSIHAMGTAYKMSGDIILGHSVLSDNTGPPWYGHGNWCGKGWSGGEYPRPGETNWDVPAVDSIDECCKKHDACFQGYDLEKKRYCKKRKSKEECNKEFVQCINNLPPEDIVNHPFLYIFYPIPFSPPFSWWPTW